MKCLPLPDAALLRGARCGSPQMHCTAGCVSAATSLAAVPGCWCSVGHRVSPCALQGAFVQGQCWPEILQLSCSHLVKLQPCSYPSTTESKQRLIPRVSVEGMINLLCPSSFRGLPHCKVSLPAFHTFSCPPERAWQAPPCS